MAALQGPEEPQPHSAGHRAVPAPGQPRSHWTPDPSLQRQVRSRDTHPHKRESSPSRRRAAEEWRAGPVRLWVSGRNGSGLGGPCAPISPSSAEHTLHRGLCFIVLRGKRAHWSLLAQDGGSARSRPSTEPADTSLSITTYSDTRGSVTIPTCNVPGVEACSVTSDSLCPEYSFQVRSQNF